MTQWTSPRAWHLLSPSLSLPMHRSDTVEKDLEDAPPTPDTDRDSITIAATDEERDGHAPVSFLQQQIVCDGRLVSGILFLFCFVSGRELFPRSNAGRRLPSLPSALESSQTSTERRSTGRDLLLSDRLVCRLSVRQQRTGKIKSTRAKCRGVLTLATDRDSTRRKLCEESWTLAASAFQDRRSTSTVQPDFLYRGDTKPTRPLPHRREAAESSVLLHCYCSSGG